MLDSIQTQHANTTCKYFGLIIYIYLLLIIVGILEKEKKEKDLQNFRREWC